jgi:polysaccharide biosynthesis transport protein
MIREVYIETTIDMRRESAGRNADWYLEQSEKAKLALTASETQRAKYAKDNNIALQGGAVLDVESAKLATLTNQSASASSVLQTAPGEAPTPPGGATLQLAAINQQLAQAAETLGPNHPTNHSSARKPLLKVSCLVKKRQLLHIVTALRQVLLSRRLMLLTMRRKAV